MKLDIYKKLGIKKVINCMGPFTTVGGSLLSKEVVAAMEEAAKSFIDINELLEKAGAQIADWLGVPAAFITSGAAAGMAISAAACMAGCDVQKAKKLPDTEGVKNEIIVFRGHRIHFDQALRIAGAQLTEVGFSDFTTPEDLKTAITENTAAILYVARFEVLGGSLPLQDVIAIAKDTNVPVIVDAADELPPVTNFKKYNDLGASLVVFSGGKALCGPQGAGLILGDTALIKACAINGSPNYGIGRPMKVAKEEIVGLTKAVEIFLKKDFQKEKEFWESQRDYIIAKLSNLAHVRCLPEESVAPGAPGSFYLPAVLLDFPGENNSFTKRRVVDELWEGDPRIAVGETPTDVIIRVMMLEKGQEKTVVDRLLDILS